ncbi:MAG TPA: bifunctional helix-turn-helix transcriptional regulator/GNAT family N-acetyltransferase [Gemmatimonadaceae bacterium]|nr:bifunctional helix-turn-helix transcriptional regulator/GNAT family N-acetyltransferase [Gemmatimonadaceae bacterium]
MARPSRTTIRSVRKFNRFYTRHVGLLQERRLRTPFSLAEARILYELGTGKRIIAVELSRKLDMDFGYLSRSLRSLERRHLIRRSRSSNDGRQQILDLTPSGRAAFRSLDYRSSDQIGKILAVLSGAAQQQLADAMGAIEGLLSPGVGTPDAGRIKLRSHRPGDMGWVVERHGALYSSEYGWDERFEGIVAGIVSDFIRNFDPVSDRCWIAELDARRVGSVFVVRKSDTTAKLRLLLVEPEARSVGLGSRLVDECIAFAGRAGYRKLTLWTNDVLHAARRIYESRGFKLAKEEPHTLFGSGLVGQTWDLKL